jgi:MFS transporter, NNP family, nitrate/nitrite transporter
MNPEGITMAKSNAPSSVPTARLNYRGAEILNWDPENQQQWQSEGRRVATRNLWVSIVAVNLAFCVWLVWSAIVINLPRVGFPYTESQLFLLAALPGISGATFRIFYSFLVPVFGGRRWTFISTALLLIPAAGIGFAVRNTETPYWLMAGLALLSGLGGGNFASSMSNISFFYPRRLQGFALGMNGGAGDFGTSVVQIIVPLAILSPILTTLVGSPQHVINSAAHGSKAIETAGIHAAALHLAAHTPPTGTPLWLQNAGFVWIPLGLISLALIAWGMNDLASAKMDPAKLLVIFRRRHNWLLSWLYLGTFGTFIGLAAAFALLIKEVFPGHDPAAWGWTGAFVGSIIRPIGGWLSDRIGGARVTFWTFVALVGTTVLTTWTVPGPGGQGGNFWWFIIAFELLFFFTGVGNGSVYRMIPVVFQETVGKPANPKDPTQVAQAAREASQESAAVIGFSSAFGAYGAFIWPRLCGSSLHDWGSMRGALWITCGVYVSCLLITWWCYYRKNAATPA